jgi:predicted aminopeptidase
MLVNNLSFSFKFANQIKLSIIVLLSVLMISCETVRYYSQAARGHLSLVFDRENIQRLLARPDIPAELRDKFNQVLLIRQYAVEELGLPVEDNYSTYVDVGREHAIWNVFAAAEFSANPVNWCYPIAGCVSYRGYFTEAGAARYARDLEADGFDVYIGGIDAYSTLGWFEDSLLSTVIERADYQLAGLIFHELAHQIVYLPGDTSFNESFATSVEREGIRRWLRRGNDGAKIIAAEANILRQQQFVELVTDYRDRFGSLYKSDLLDEEKREGKAQLQEDLRQSYRDLKRDWNGYDGYDNWFSQSLNNAQLATVSSYNELVPYFNDLLIQSDNNLDLFFEKVRSVANLDRSDREERLQDYL